jgi:hypothetical protein
MALLINWSFWSFRLVGGGGISTGGTFFAEVVFGFPLIVVPPLKKWNSPPPKPGPAAPVKNLNNALDNTNLVAVTAGLGGSFQCSGTMFRMLQLGTNTIQNTPVGLNNTNSNVLGPTSVTVNNGKATIKALGISFSEFSSTGKLDPAPYLSLSGASYAYFDYAPSISCLGTWQPQPPWAVYAPFGSFSLSTPLFPPPPISGGVFPN